MRVASPPRIGVSDETRASRDFRDENASCGRRRRAACNMAFLLGLERPTMRAVRVILRRAVRFLGRGVEFPDMP